MFVNKHFIYNISDAHNSKRKCIYNAKASVYYVYAKTKISVEFTSALVYLYGFRPQLQNILDRCFCVYRICFCVYIIGKYLSSKIISSKDISLKPELY